MTNETFATMGKLNAMDEGILDAALNGEMSMTSAIRYAVKFQRTELLAILKAS